MQRCVFDDNFQKRRLSTQIQGTGLFEYPRGLRHPLHRAFDVVLAGDRAGFELLVDAIISQPLSKKAVDSIVQNFRRLFTAGRVTPNAFLAKPKASFLAIGLSRRKYEYITDFCYKISESLLDLPSLNNESDEQVRLNLKTIKGIGDWTVDRYLLFGLGRLDIFPIHD